MSKRRAPSGPPAGGPWLQHDAAELRHLAACAWNFALTDRHRPPLDWRLFSFRREVDLRRHLPFWYQANEDDLRRRGQRDHPQLVHPFVEAPLVRWLRPREQTRNAFSCGVADQPAFLPVNTVPFDAAGGATEATLLHRAAVAVERQHFRLLNARLMALFVHCLLRGQAALLSRPRRP
jgi:hypothetical protein